MLLRELRDEICLTLVEHLMETGPTTVRPDESLAAVKERMQRRGVASLVVATNEGTLIGILDREQGKRVLVSRVRRLNPYEPGWHLKNMG